MSVTSMLASTDCVFIVLETIVACGVMTGWNLDLLGILFQPSGSHLSLLSELPLSDAALAGEGGQHRITARQ